MNTGKKITAYGTFHVTTEGDVEGRSVKDLGIHTGFIDEIAFRLVNQSLYSLHFKQIDTEYYRLKPQHLGDVEVILEIDSGTWDMSSEQRADYLREILKGRDVSVKEGKYFASVIIHSDVYDTIEQKKQEALNKLSDEEKSLLGLKSLGDQGSTCECHENSKQ